jgi:hypothetical protein
VPQDLDLSGLLVTCSPTQPLEQLPVEPRERTGQRRPIAADLSGDPGLDPALPLQLDPSLKLAW